MGLRQQLVLSSSRENETADGVHPNGDLQPVTPRQPRANVALASVSPLSLLSPTQPTRWSCSNMSHSGLFGFWVAEPSNISLYQVPSSSISAGLPQPGPCHPRHHHRLPPRRRPRHAPRLHGRHPRHHLSHVLLLPPSGYAVPWPPSSSAAASRSSASARSPSKAATLSPS